MTRHQNKLLRLDLAGDLAERVPYRPLLIVVLDMHLDAGRSRSDVVSERKPALPISRHYSAPDVSQELECLTV